MLGSGLECLGILLDELATTSTTSMKVVRSLSTVTYFILKVGFSMISSSAVVDATKTDINFGGDEVTREYCF